MATVEEVIAKAEAWEKAGKPENAAKLRAYAETLKPAAPKYDAATVEAKAAEWEKAGDPAKAAKLREFAATLPKVGPVKASQPDTGPSVPKIDSEAPVAKDDRLVAMFEAANPTLKGRYKTAADLPKVGEAVIGQGGGGKSGGARVTVQPWQNVKEDTFGETAGAMMEGPMAAASAFSAGLSGGESPSYNYLRESGLPRGLAGPLSKVGDIGGAGLSLFGAGISGAAGLLSEVVPGQNSADERALAEDLTGMAMFAVPELAGASSVPARIAAAAPKAAPVVVKAAPKVADDVAAAERLGIPVMRSDVAPPKTAVGKIAQRVGESIPFAGTAGMRAKQFAARGEAVMDFVQEYVGDTLLPAIDNVAAAMLEKRGADLKRFTGMKTQVVEKLKAKGAVPVPKATAEIDRQIAGLKAQRLGELEPVIAKLQDFKRSLADQPLDVLEKNRKAVGSAFADPGLANIRDAGEKALSAIYGPLRDDIGAFVKQAGGAGDAVKWQRANGQLAEMAGQLKDGALKRVLTKGEETPEAVRSMLFSQKPSDVKRLAEALPENGKAAARTAIVQEAIAKAGGIENLSVERFKNALEKMNSQIGVFFKGEDMEAAQGLLRALRLTEQAAKAGAAPLTGVQNMPAVITLLLSSFTGGSIVGTSAALGTIGGIARIYESTGVKTALRRLSKMQGPKAEAAGIKMLEDALKKAGMPASAQSASAPMPMAVGQN
jgi:hypothetical protein